MEHLLFCGVHLPFFAAQVWLQNHPDWHDVPFLFANSGEGGGVTDLSPLAYRRRVPLSVSTKEIQERWPDIRLLPPKPDLQQVALSRLRALCETQTPSCAWEDETLLLDLAGTSRLHGPQNEWLERLLGQVRALGFPLVRAALAPYRSAAAVLARSAHAPGTQLYGKQETRSALAKVALWRLPGVSEDLKQRMRANGLRTLGDLQKLDRRFLLSHFGEAAEALYALAQGSDLRYEIRSTSQSSIECVFHMPISLRASLRHECEQQVELLAEHVSRLGLRVKQMEIVLHLDDGRILRAKGKVGAQGIKTCGIDLLSQIPPLGAPVVRLECHALRVETASPQTDLFSSGNEL